uniref:DUF3046 domain-containing protein n=1 Tax=Vaginimicrobium propionicum TaxID=1871034 RepID=UPI0009713497|nr:DUF3046 domain-containing protein [Vaginimicrobium propionicum]
MREQELWQRLNESLGQSYALVWTEQTVLADLDSRTVRQALHDGVACKTIWRAVWKFLELPDSKR